MKKIKVIKKVLLIALFFIGMISTYFIVNNNKNEIKEYKELNDVNSKRFKMYLQYSDDEYIEKKGNWSDEEYILNVEKTVCTDGFGNEVKSEIEYNNGTIKVKTKSSIFCNIYFDLPPILISGQSFYLKIPEDAKQIIFTDEVAPVGSILIDLSSKKDKGIVGWMDDTTFKVSSQKEGKKVIANPDSSYMFFTSYNIEYIDVSLLDTSRVTNMHRMFAAAGGESATFIVEGFDSWDTSKVTDMSVMFQDAGESTTTFNLTGLGSWDTSSVTDMSAMFRWSGRSANTYIIEDLSNWDTSNVTDMGSMFSYSGEKASNWSVSGLSSWDTGKVTDMSNMFERTGFGWYGTWSLGDLSSWDTSNVTNMEFMFDEAGRNANNFNLSGLDSWDTGKVTDMRRMLFCAGQYAEWSSYIDCSNWDVSKVEYYGGFNDGVESKVTPPKWKK